MKRLLCICLVMAFGIVSALAQGAPEAFNYSGVARNASNLAIANTTIGLQLSILQGNPTTGTVVYQENHFTNTDANGLFNVSVGTGAVQSGVFANISWGNDDYYLRVGFDANGGTNFLVMGSTQLLSVPYALYAKSAGNVQYQTLSISNDTVYLTNGGFVKLPNTNTGFTHYIGEQFGGGVIFNLWKDAQGIEHGLIVSLNDTFSIWSNIDQTIVGPSAQSKWDGQTNTTAIINQPGHVTSAAKLCDDYVFGGFSDWYLPSNEELYLLFANFNVNKTLRSINGSDDLVSVVEYWSSTEFGNIFAYSMSPANGQFLSGTGGNKSSVAGVRPIRAF